MPNFDQSRQRNNRERRPRTKVTYEQLIKILDGHDAQGLVNLAESIAKNELLGPKEKVSTSQIRNICGTVKKLEMKACKENVIPELILLKPKLAYVAGRYKNITGMKFLKDILSQAIDLVAEKEERFVYFCKFFEAILAYHKAEGGR
ncbi:type III-A CRISPR-associated protein Csm2 [Desulfovulcanus sp.]